MEMEKKTGSGDPDLYGEERSKEVGRPEDDGGAGVC